nr:transporter substrate-binding domain-containing protein [Desulfobotulus alkaliphilus]
MRVVYFDNFPPFSWKGENGKMQGIFIDVLDEVIQNHLGIRLYHEGLPWARAQKMVKDGNADAFVTIPTPERKSYTEVSREPVLISYMTIFTKKGHEKLNALEKVNTLDDLKEYIILDYIGNGWGDKNLTGFRRDLSPRLDTVFRMLAAGRGDINITDSMVALHRLKELNLQEEIVEIPIVLDEVPMSLCIGKYSSFAHILPEFDRTMEKLRKNSTLQSIYSKYR